MIEVFGVNEAIAKMLRLGLLAEHEAEDAAVAGAQPILQAAQENVPVDTGALKGTLRIESGTDGGVAHADVIAGDDTVDYAQFVEFSPDNEPFLRPAVDSEHDRVIEEITVRFEEVP